MNMDIWVIGTSNQLFMRGSETETKTPFFMIGPLLTILFVLTLAPDKAVLYRNDAFSILVL